MYQFIYITKLLVSK